MSGFPKYVTLEEASDALERQRDRQIKRLEALHRKMFVQSVLAFLIGVLVGLVFAC